MKNSLRLLFLILSFHTAVSQQAVYWPSFQGGHYQVTCFTPTVFFSILDNSGNAQTLTCIGCAVPYTGTLVPFTSAGLYTVNFNNNMMFPVNITADNAVPISSLSSNFQSISNNQSPQNVTLTAVSPIIGVTHYVYSPFSGTYSSSTSAAAYHPPGTGTYTYCLVNDANGCSSCKQFSIELSAPSVGLTSELDLKNSVSIYPNPVKDMIGIKGLETLTKPSKIEVLNSLGELVVLMELDPANLPKNLSTEGFANGMYVLRIKTSDSNLHTGRFVISK